MEIVFERARSCETRDSLALVLFNLYGGHGTYYFNFFEIKGVTIEAPSLLNSIDDCIILNIALIDFRCNYIGMYGNVGGGPTCGWDERTRVVVYDNIEDMGTRVDGGLQ
jgi:hypothetical protein